MPMSKYKPVGKRPTGFRPTGQPNPVQPNILPPASKLTEPDDNRLFTPVEINNRVYSALIDTGSGRSFIGNSINQYLETLKIPKQSCSLTTMVANGVEVKIPHTYKLTIGILGQKIKHKFYYMENLADEAILGIDFLKTGKISLCLLGKNITDLPITTTSSIKIENKTLAEVDQKRITHFLSKQLARFEHISGPTHISEHHIHMKHDRPIKQRYFPRNPAMQKIIDKEIDELLHADRIEPSKSPYSSPIVIVRKKQGDWRLCVDFRQLNEHSTKDAYPLPQINAILDKLRGAQFLSTIDLKQGYWQIPLAYESRKYTAFTVPGRGLFQWKVMPFGLHSAPATFQRTLDQVIGPELEPIAFAYLDDIIVTGRSLDEHIRNLKVVFDKLIEAKLKINPDKCEFFRNRLKYLGHVVCPEGIQTDPEKVRAINELKPPTNLKTLRRFLGVASWYRRFIPDFAKIVTPLTRLLKKNIKWEWKIPQETAFNCLKQKLTDAPILACPDFTQPFILQTDASQEGLGAVLCQKINKEERVIAYASRSLNSTEIKYSVTEKECLAVVWGVRKMRPYLEGYRFTIITDHQALKWLNSIDNPSGRLARWALELQQYDYQIEYRKGKFNIVADALSREPLPTTAAVSEKEKTCNWYNTKMKEVKDHPAQHPDFMIKDGQLYRRIYTPSNHIDDDILSPWKLCVPGYLRPRVLKENHDDPTAGHRGIQKTICKISKMYYWPGMFRDIAKYVRQCDSCLRHKISQQKRAGEMHMTKTEEPWEIISADFMGPFPRSKRGNTVILVFQDKFTKWAEFIPLHDATTPALIKAFREHIFGQFGCPKTLISDNGRQFTSHKFRDLLQSLGINHRLTPPYTPQANPTERTNRVLKNMIAQYVKEDHREWDKYLPELKLAYNTSQSEVTGYSPAFLNFGREPLLPTSLYSEVGNNNLTQYQSPDIKAEKLRNTFKIVRLNLGKAFTKQSHYYNLRRRPWKPQIGELVLKKDHKLSSAQKNFSAKLSPKFHGPFRISKILSPVIVELSTPAGKTSSQAHVKDLKPYPHSNPEQTSEQISNPTKKPSSNPTKPTKSLSVPTKPKPSSAPAPVTYKRANTPDRRIISASTANKMGPTSRRLTRPRRPPTTLKSIAKKKAPVKTSAIAAVSAKSTPATLPPGLNNRTQLIPPPAQIYRPFEARPASETIQQAAAKFRDKTEDSSDEEIVSKIERLMIIPPTISPITTPPRNKTTNNPTATMRTTTGLPILTPPDATTTQEPQTAATGNTLTYPPPIQQAIDTIINNKPKKKLYLRTPQGPVRANKNTAGIWTIWWNKEKTTFPGPQ